MVHGAPQWPVLELVLVRILFVDIDTLRPDHLGCYGYHRATSPNIDEIARRGIRFTNAYASDVPCLPSRTALVTGTFGIRNGVNNHGGAAADLASRGADRTFFNQWVTNSLPRCWPEPGCTPPRSRASRCAMAPTGGAEDSASRWTSPPATASSGPIRSYPVRWTGSIAGDGPRTGSSTCTCGTRTRRTTLPLRSATPSPAIVSRRGIPSRFAPAIGSSPVPTRPRNRGGFRPDEWGPPGPRSPWNLADADDVKQMFDGYDTGLRYAEEAVGVLANRLADLDVLDTTAIWISSDHGEGFGDLRVYADHQGADEATTHIPAVLSWPGLPASVQTGLAYHLDVAATVVDLAGARRPSDWDGISVREAVQAGTDAPGREHLVLTQGAWTAQRGVRTGDHLYLHTRHDGFHASWPDEMLFDVVADPHEQVDLASDDVATTTALGTYLDEWIGVELARSYARQDPLTTIVEEGGPFHVRGHLPAYLDRLRDTGRGRWISTIAERHPTD